MDAGLQAEALAALLRLIGGRGNASEAAVYRIGEHRLERVAASAAATGARLRPDLDLASLDAARATGAPVWVAPRALGFAAPQAVLIVARGSDVALAVGLSRRRLGARAAAALADAVRLAGAVAAGAVPAGAPETFACSTSAPAHRPVATDGRPIAERTSAGVAAEIGSAEPTGLAIRRAETATRRAKAEGCNRVAVQEPARDSAALEMNRLELDLAEAPARGQMRLAYQSFFEVATGRVAGVEALLRWRHPLRGELAPAAFIPLAEATGLILPLGNWALRTALAAAAAWPSRLCVAVNVSALQFHQPGFVAEVEAALAETGVPAERLELEITETVLMRDNPETKAQLDALIARGVRIALDDFGTGYSALAYLARLPHHRIKLDRAFVHDLANPATHDLVRAILALARKTGVMVTAEGVERPDQLAQVRALGFSHAQGFVNGPPVADPSPLIAETTAAE